MPSPRSYPKRPVWADYSDDRLLALRMCDLGLALQGTVLEPRIERLYAELEAKGLRFRPHIWLSTEWFSPDGVPGLAIPFYLAHPRLMELEREQVLDVEGGTARWFMQLLRHETAHALDTAYRLHRLKKWRDHFGKFSARYEQYYQPKPYSKSYVLHLDMWYAQSHPAEDWAETFAVWLDPTSAWRRRYQDWPALKKLVCVDEICRDIADKPAPVRSRERVEPLTSLKITLRQHYEKKKERWGVDVPSFYDRDLRRLFPEPEPDAKKRARSAAAMLRRVRHDVCKAIAFWTGEYRYTINQVLLDMIDRCEELGLTTTRDETSFREDAMVLLAVQTMNYLHAGHHRLAR